MSRFCLGFLAVAAIVMCGCDDSDKKTNDNTGCQEAQARCLNGVRQICSAAGAWENAPCTGEGEVCSDATGTAICTKGNVNPVDCESGKTQCVGTMRQTCNDSKRWEDTPCTGEGEVCSDASGTVECVPKGSTKTCKLDETKCDGETLLKCNAKGEWKETPCAVAGQVCSDASGTAKCDRKCGACCEGEVRCDDNGTEAVLWTCDANLQWKSDKCPASDVTDARLTCKNADSCSTYICTDSNYYYDGNSRQCLPLDHSSHCSQGRSYCNGKTNILYECLGGDDSPIAATDCGAKGKACVKIDDNESRCVQVECSDQFCDGDTLVFCTKDNQIELNEDGSRHERDCTEVEDDMDPQVCDFDGEYWLCMNQCVEGNQSCAGETQYYECKDGHEGLPHTCPDGKKCSPSGPNRIECI